MNMGYLSCCFGFFSPNFPPDVELLLNTVSVPCSTALILLWSRKWNKLIELCVFLKKSETLWNYVIQTVKYLEFVITITAQRFFTYYKSDLWINVPILYKCYSLNEFQLLAWKSSLPRPSEWLVSLTDIWRGYIRHTNALKYKRVMVLKGSVIIYPWSYITDYMSWTLSCFEYW